MKLHTKISYVLACMSSLFINVVFAQECLEFEPKKVSLSGILIQKTYPGPPNFESISNGDRAETGYYLQLATAICVRAGKEDDAGDHDDVRELQLVLSTSKVKTLRAALGSRVTLRGSLFEAHTGHHHTPVLLIVRENHDN